MSSKMAVHYSSETPEWETPQDFFDRLNREFQFEVDVCAQPHNAKCARYFTPEMDGLKQAWGGLVCWMNPPYGDPEQPCGPHCRKKRCQKRGYCLTEYVPGIIDWVRKAYLSSREEGATVVCLLPARTDTKWWHDYVMQSDEIRLVKGRLKFGGSRNSAPFPSAVVIFRPGRPCKNRPLLSALT